ncbi:MAG: hypothetical protein RLZZ15_1610 [Verrucomicrobiota bacterium]
MPHYTRRDFTKLALAAVPAAGLLSLPGAFAADSAAKPAKKPNSKVNGVQIGLNVPYSFGAAVAQPTGDQILENCLALGVSGVELRTQSVEVFLGAPADLVYTKRAVATGDTAALREWRTGAKVAGAAAYRKKFEDAGVLIEVVKVDGIFKMNEAELDYVFSLGKTLGARALSTEISTGATKDADHKRVGAFADKHGLRIGYHGHTHTGPKEWEETFALAKHNGANVDIGHFVAGLNMSPVEFIKQRHDRITHIHVKDKKMNGGAACPFGEGDTPIVEILRLIRDNKWPIQATIEFEYKVPAGSDRMTEIAKTIKFCRDALA